MPSLRDRSKKKKKRPTAVTSNGSPYPVAHIVTPAHKLDDAKRGEPVTALCGATITGDPDPEAGICAKCTTVQFEKDDKDSDDRAQKRYEAGLDAGKNTGKREGRQERDREIRTAAEEATRREREQLERTRFVDDGSGTIRFEYQDGSVGTARKDRVGSVRLAPAPEGHAVLVDGVVLIAHSDEALVRRHYDQVHQAVFGG